MEDLTFGQKAVGLTFNPSGDPQVIELKQAAAVFIDLCNDTRAKSESPEVKRMMSVAVTEAQTAQMWAVKGITWQDS